MPRPQQTRGDLIKVANEIWDDDSPQISYMASLFVQCSLPYKNPGPIPVWTRRNGDLTLRVQPGYTFNENGDDVSLGYPSGVMPRLLLNWMSTEAVRSRSPELELGDSLREFMAKLNLKPTGGKTGNIARLHTNMQRLFRARMSVHIDTGDRQQGADLSIASAWDLQWPTHAENPGQRSLLPSVVRLAPDFFKQVIESPVPVNMDALIALRGSAFRLDLYTWLTYRMSYLSAPTTLRWELLADQFGYQIGDSRFSKRQFKRDITAHLEKVLLVYREARVEVLDSGLKLSPSPTHVPFRGMRELRRNS